MYLMKKKTCMEFNLISIYKIYIVLKFKKKKGICYTKTQSIMNYNK